MVLTAGRGEQNDLTVNQVNSATLVDSLRAPAFGFAISDRKAPLHAGGGCMSLDLYSASCSFSADTTTLSVSLGDGNHRLDARAVTAPVQVTTGHGNNLLLTGSGNDTFAPGAGRNILDGGDGENTVDFVQPAQPVRVDLQSSAPQGTTTSQNILRHIQDVQATRSPHDVLLGSNGPNTLYAGRYSYVNGRGGNDRLFGGPGSIIIAGGGRDELSGDQVRPGIPGRTFRCGSGLDTVEASLLDLVSPNCALVKIDQGSTDRFVRLDSIPAPNRPFVALRYGCYFPPSCSVVIAARLGSDTPSARHDVATAPCGRSSASPRGRSRLAAHRLVDPENHRSFEHITLHPQLADLPPKPDQLLPLILHQGTRNAGRTRLLDPVPQRPRMHPEIPADLSQRPASLQHDPYRAVPEILVELPPLFCHETAPHSGLLHDTRGRPTRAAAAAAARHRSTHGWLVAKPQRGEESSHPRGPPGN